jgi:hypothetical protein
VIFLQKKIIISLTQLHVYSSYQFLKLLSANSMEIILHFYSSSDFLNFSFK